MPRNTRNFWVELKVDGKKTAVASGPASKDGGFDLIVKQRDRGGIITSLVVTGRAKVFQDEIHLTLTADGEGVATAVTEGGVIVLKCKTVR
jgi:hypothetical protein